MTIEEGLREIVAEHSLHRLDIGFSNYAHGSSFNATAWWNGGHSCASGRAQTVDEAVNEAIAAMIEGRGFTLAAEAA